VLKLVITAMLVKLLTFRQQPVHFVKWRRRLRRRFCCCGFVVCNGSMPDWWPQGRWFDSRPSKITLGKLFTHVCLCSQSSIIWYRSKDGDWEGNRRSGVALAVSQTQLSIYLRAQWPTYGKWAPRLRPLGLATCCCCCCCCCCS